MPFYFSCFFVSSQILLFKYYYYLLYRHHVVLLRSTLSLQLWNFLRINLEPSVNVSHFRDTCHRGAQSFVGVDV